MNKQKLKSFISNPFTVSFALLFILLFAVTCKQILKSNDYNKLLSFSSKINEINLKTTKNTEVSSTEFINSFNDNILKLNQINTDLTALNISKEYSDEKSLLLDSISKNTKFYNDIIYMLKNIDAPNIMDINKQVTLSKTELEKSFEASNKKSLKLDLNYTENSINPKAFNYMNQILKLKRDSDIAQSQSTDFKSSLDFLFTQFEPLNEDLFEILKLVKEDGRNITPILDTINSNIENFNLLNTDLHCISVPHGYEEYFLSLQNVFDKYNSYIKLMRDYVISEIAKKPDKKLYNDAKSAYTELNKEIIKFEKSFSKLK